MDSELRGFGVGLEDTQIQHPSRLKARVFGAVDSRLQPCPKAVIRWASPLSPQGSSPSSPSVLTGQDFQASLSSLQGAPLAQTRASAIPSGFYKAPAGPFGKRISFFLDAFPDLGATEGLCAGSRRSLAWGGGAGGLDPQNTASPGPFGQTLNFRLGLLDCFLLRRRSRRRWSF